MNNEKVKKVNDLLGSNVGNRIINVTFRKKDGSLRSMLLKRDKDLEASVKGTRPEAKQRLDSFYNQGMNNKRYSIVENLVQAHPNEAPFTEYQIFDNVLGIVFGVMYTKDSAEKVIALFNAEADRG